jgi:hypothetical protein
MRERQQRLPKKAKVTWKISVMETTRRRSGRSNPILDNVIDKLTRCAENRAWRSEHYMVAEHPRFIAAFGVIHIAAAIEIRDVGRDSDALAHWFLREKNSLNHAAKLATRCE